MEELPEEPENNVILTGESDVLECTWSAGTVGIQEILVPPQESAGRCLKQHYVATAQRPTIDTDAPL